MEIDFNKVDIDKRLQNSRKFGLNNYFGVDSNGEKKEEIKEEESL